jgi:5-methylcytosine-specific restriction endonuclease McrA
VIRAQVLREQPFCMLELPGCTRISTTVDHIIPLTLGGHRTDRGNLQAACAHCNYSKGARLAAARPRPPALAFFDVDDDEDGDDDERPGVA